MKVRFKITLLFVVTNFITLSIVCGVAYYFAFMERMDNMTTRLTNRAITSAKIFNQNEIFDDTEVRQIHLSTAISMQNKTVLVFNKNNQQKYEYYEVPGDKLLVTKRMLNVARASGKFYFKQKDKEAVAFHDKISGHVIISAGKDVEGKERFSALSKILFYSFLIGNILVLISGYLFSGKLLLPIKKITKDLAEISDKNLTRRIKIGETKDEWYELSFTLNELLDRLKQSFDLQRRFISNASHELFTPLTSITTQIDITLQRKRDPEIYRKIMQSVSYDVKNLSKLTSILLEFSRASENKEGLQIDQVRMDEIIFSLPIETAKVNSAYAVEIIIDELPEEEEKMTVSGNEALLLTAIKNIVINACKYSTDQRAIVHLRSHASHISILVIDNGKGISEEHLSNIFQPFYRVTDNLNTDGFGLGLSLAEKIIKMHLGTIKVKSILGSGSQFEITLPQANEVELV